MVSARLQYLKFVYLETHSWHDGSYLLIQFHAMERTFGKAKQAMCLVFGLQLQVHVRALFISGLVHETVITRPARQNTTELNLIRPS